MSRPAVLLVADSTRPATSELLDEVRAALRRHVDILAELHPDRNDGLTEAQRRDARAVVVVGGDGTLIGQAARFVDDNLPLVGVNTGRLGFLAEFDPEALRDHGETIFGEAPPIQEVIVLDVHVHCASGSSDTRCLAVNDAVITAGPPFQMIELSIAVNGVPGPTLTGDGVIVATPVGSTAYNISAGGPILHPSIEAMVITPLAAHSLAFRPIVLSAMDELTLHIRRANDGTTLMHDGRQHGRVADGDVVTIRPYERKNRFIINPATSYWHIIQDKLRWAAPPNYRSR